MQVDDKLKAEYYDLNKDDWYEFPVFDFGKDLVNKKVDESVCIFSNNGLLCLISQKWDGVLSLYIDGEYAEWKWKKDKHDNKIDLMNLLDHGKSSKHKHDRLYSLDRSSHLLCDTV